MKKRGIKLSDGVFHEQDHIEFSRRRFLKSFGLAGGMGFMIGKMPMRTSALSKWFIPPNLELGDRVLVLVRLKGGNDGINTIVPLDYLTEYHNLRPQLGYRDNEMIQLDDKHAMSPDMSLLKPLWDDGMMKVINGVGYPEQNYSHFRSSDIWSSASSSEEVVQSGWIARYGEEVYPDYTLHPPTDPPAVQIGGASSLLFTGEHNAKVGFEAFSAEQLLDIVANGSIHNITDVPDCQFGDQLKYLRILVNNTFIFVDRITSSYNAGPETAIAYDDNEFSQALKSIVRLIKGGLKTKIFVIELDGFDTHANQLDDHPQLLQIFSKGISDFYKDLDGSEYDDKVLTVTFSEFGRRVEENDGPGTDHGSANVMLAFGKGLNGNGVVGKYPSLAELDDYDNLIFTTDFRRVYSTLLTEWLCLPDPEDDQVLFGDHGTPLDLGFNCLDTSSVTQSEAVNPFRHSAVYNSGNIYINYSLPVSSLVMVEVISADGKPFLVQRPMHKDSGEYTITYHAKERGLKPGAYFYRVRMTGRDMTGKLVVY